MTNALIRPLITEKTLTHAARGWYTFIVDEASDKNAIADAISKFYKVTVTDVRTAIMHGKMRRSGRRQTYRKLADWKKAAVRLSKGQTIDAFEVTAPEQPKEEKKEKKEEKKEKTGK